MNQNAISFVEETLMEDKKISSFKAGDTITVRYRIVEEKKERVQNFKGIVIKRQGTGKSATFTVRKISENISVERTFPVFSPFIESIEVHKIGKVRRAKLFYLRERQGKALRIKEKRIRKKEPSADKK